MPKKSNLGNLSIKIIQEYKSKVSGRWGQLHILHYPKRWRELSSGAGARGAAPGLWLGWGLTLLGLETAPGPAPPSLAAADAPLAEAKFGQGSAKAPILCGAKLLRKRESSMLHTTCKVLRCCISAPSTIRVGHIPLHVRVGHKAACSILLERCCKPDSTGSKAQ